MDDFNNTGFDLVLSDAEKEQLLKHFTDQAYQDFLDELPNNINSWRLLSLPIKEARQ